MFYSDPLVKSSKSLLKELIIEGTSNGGSPKSTMTNFGRSFANATKINPKKVPVDFVITEENLKETINNYFNKVLE